MCVERGEETLHLRPVDIHLRPLDMCVERGEETQKNQGERVGRKCARLGVFVRGRGMDSSERYGFES